MRIIYIIFAHKLPEQLVRLVGELNTDTAQFLIHIDKKMNENTYLRAFNPLKDYGNVTFLHRYRRYYGDYNIVRATLNGIQKLLASGDPFDYVILISGQDYPTKSNNQIEKTLRESGGQSFMEYFALPSGHWLDEGGGLNRIKYRHVHLGNRAIPLFRKNRYLQFIPDRLWSALVEILPLERSLPGGFKPYGGSSWWCLTRECIEYIGGFVEENPDFVKFFKHVKIPEEIFFQTVLMNSRYKNKIINDSMRYIIWPTGSRHPATLGKQNFASIMDSNKLFARKFDVTVDAEVLDMIDEKIS